MITGSHHGVKYLENICNKLGVEVTTSKLNESISNLYFLMNTSKNVNSCCGKFPEFVSKNKFESIKLLKIF